jgi:membrane protease subunit (stomatin/prohibitin family)
MGKDYGIYNIENERSGELFNCQAVQDKLEKKSEFIVKEGTVAFILNDGVRQQTLQPGRYEIFGKKHGLAGTFDKKRISTLRVIFISNKDAKKIVKWGIPNTEMPLTDPLTDVDYKLGAFGDIEIQISNPEKFFTEWLTAESNMSIEGFQELMLPKLKSIVSGAIIKTIETQGIPYSQVAGKRNAIAEEVIGIVRAEFEKKFGISVSDFLITNTLIPQDDLDKLESAKRENKDEIKTKQRKIDEKAEQDEERKAVIAELERLNNRENEKIKLLADLEMKNRQMYLDVCRHIGWEPKPKTMVDAPVAGTFCTSCGSKAESGHAFCSKCGKKIKGE